MSNIDIAKEVIETEILGLNQLKNNINDQFSFAVDAILNTPGKVIICGMGKSGIIGKKIAASFASTGTSSFFMHPGEAFHGDLGMVTSNDIFVAISNSGETDEVLKLLPFLKDNKNVIISMTGNPGSTLAINANIHLNISVPQEACHLQLAPTSSTTATLVMGDALTVALMKKRDFQPENFARFHPGGSLGRRLLSKISDEMITTDFPFINAQTSIVDVIHIMTKGQIGVALLKEGKKVIGIVTDGDLRRAMEVHQKNIFDLKVNDIVTLAPLSIIPDARVQSGIEMMEKNKVNSLIVQNEHEFFGIFKK
jgi:arabinose-5-phosphate isomerase